MLDFEPRRIALIKPSALGDIVHSLPVLTALRQRFPVAHIAWIVNRVYEPLLHHHPHLDATIAFDRTLARRGYVAATLGFTHFLRQLQMQRFDLAIDLQGLFRTGVMAFATRARRRIGLASAREGATCFYTHRVDDRTGVSHAVDRYWRVVEKLGGGKWDKQFIVPIDPAARSWARTLLHGRPRPWLAVGVGARWLTKRWPPQHFASLTQRVLNDFGGTAIFVGALDERELTEQSIARLRGNSISVAGETTLPQLAALLAEADVMLANDTGPLHLAVALGRPVVAPYTCTRTARTGPYGQPGRGVETSVWCAGSYLKQCDRLECMGELTPERLWPALQSILMTWQQQRHSA